MATLALSLVGSSFGPAGGMIGAFVGGLIDNYLLFPALFPVPNTEGPRIDGISVTSANEGTPMNWSMGPRTRVGGCVLWMSDLDEVKNSQNVGKGGGPSNISYEYYASIAIGFGEAKPQTIDRLNTLLADVKSIYNDASSSFYDSITLYNGTQTSPDPYLVGVLGNGNVPSFKKQVYIVIHRLFLGEFGNRVPNFQAFIRQSNDVSVADLLNKILERCGYTGSEYDTSRVSTCLRGINFSGITTGKDMLERTMGTFNLGLQEIDGKLQFFDKGKEVAITVNELHLSGDSYGLRAGEEFDRGLPDEVASTFVSDDLNLQPGATRYRDTSRSDSSRENQIRFDSPATLTSEEANIMTRRIYWQAFGERRQYTFSLPQRYVNLAAGDVIKIVRKNIPIYMRLQKAEYGANGRIDCTAVMTWKGIFDQDGFGNESGFGGIDMYTPPELDYFIGDMASLGVDGVDSPWIYWGARLKTPTDQFRGAVLSASLTNESYAEVSNVTRESTWGLTQTGPDPNVFDTSWDDSSTLLVETSGGFSPTSATDNEVLGVQRNIIAVRQQSGEWEIMGFVNATPLGDSQFILTRLLRGLRGTGHLIPSHTSGNARVVFLTEEAIGVGEWEAGTLFLGTPYYKIASYLEPVSAADPHQLSILGRSMRPFSPALLSYVRQTLPPILTIPQENVAITWSRRSKKLLDAFGAAGGPLATDEGPETYRVTLRLGGQFSPILYETIVTNATRFDFTQTLRDAASAATPSWSENNGFRVFVSQVSTVVGDSPFAELRVYPR
jgi:hypothetical protein